MGREPVGVRLGTSSRRDPGGTLEGTLCGLTSDGLGDGCGHLRSFAEARDEKARDEKLIFRPPPSQSYCL